MMIKNHNLNGMYFTTKDRDNDRNGGNCAASYASGGWWYNSCTWSSLNGRYPKSSKDKVPALFWGLKGETMRTTVMMVRTKK
jgi:hypothetical protein